jgi:hypothetical protein
MDREIPGKFIPPIISSQLSGLPLELKLKQVGRYRIDITFQMEHDGLTVALPLEDNLQEFNFFLQNLEDFVIEIAVYSSENDSK